jgi:hypothetical protein
MQGVPRCNSQRLTHPSKHPSLRYANGDEEIALELRGRLSQRAFGIGSQALAAHAMFGATVGLVGATLLRRRSV